MRSFFEPVIRAIEDLIRSSADGIVDLQTPGSLKVKRDLSLLRTFADMHR